MRSSWKPWYHMEVPPGKQGLGMFGLSTSAVSFRLWHVQVRAVTTGSRKHVWRLNEDRDRACWSSTAASCIQQPRLVIIRFPTQFGTLLYCLSPLFPFNQKCIGNSYYKTNGLFSGICFILFGWKQWSATRPSTKPSGIPSRQPSSALCWAACQGVASRCSQKFVRRHTVARACVACIVRQGQSPTSWWRALQVSERPPSARQTRDESNWT
jgi:hypothetical protein